MSKDCYQETQAACKLSGWHHQWLLPLWLLPQLATQWQCSSLLMVRCRVQYFVVAIEPISSQVIVLRPAAPAAAAPEPPILPGPAHQAADAAATSCETPTSDVGLIGVYCAFGVCRWLPLAAVPAAPAAACSSVL